MSGFFVVFSIMFALLSGMSLYISYRVYQGIAIVLPQVRLIYIVVFFALMLVLMILGFASSMLSVPVKVKQLVGAAGACWMGIFSYLLFYTVVIDLIFLLCRLFKAAFVQDPASRGVFSLIMITFALLTSLYGICHAQQIKQVAYEVPVENKKDISDMNPESPSSIIYELNDKHLSVYEKDTLVYVEKHDDVFYVIKKAE